MDDRRLDPIWQAAGKPGLPVVIHHVADPAASFDPVDNNPERWEAIVARHPKTTFIGAHAGFYRESGISQRGENIEN